MEVIANGLARRVVRPTLAGARARSRPGIGRVGRLGEMGFWCAWEKLRPWCMAGNWLAGWSLGWAGGQEGLAEGERWGRVAMTGGIQGDYRGLTGDLQGNKHLMASWAAGTWVVSDVVRRMEGRFRWRERRIGGAFLGPLRRGWRLCWRFPRAAAGGSVGAGGGRLP